MEKAEYFFGDRGDGKMVCCLPAEPEKRKRLAEALKYQIKQDTNEKDREIHKYVLAQLEQD